MRRWNWRVGLLAGVMTLGSVVAPAAHAGTGSVASEELTSAAALLGAGEYAWSPVDQPAAGRVNIVVSIPLQQLFVYRGDQLIAVSAVSTGSPGHETPVGEFTILQKDVNHRSNKYNSAPMPFMERLTWDGVAIHGGHDPGYPDSHGCVRVPLAFAKKLFAITSLGARVSVVDETTAPGLPDDYARLTPVGRDAVASAAVAASATDIAATKAANLGQVY